MSQLVATALVAVLSGLGGGASSSSTAPGSVTAAAPSPAEGPVVSLLGRRPPPPPGVATPAALRRRPAGGRPAPPAAPGMLGRVAPGQETPEDTQFTAAASAPGPTETTAPTIVALGMGQSCACPVLFESTDGGATWTPSPLPAPPDAKQVVLPPGYPGDPRIFVGTDAVGGLVTYVVPRFGELATPLPGPSGQLALAAGFDAGDDRVFVAGQDAVVAISLDGPLPRLEPVLTYAGAPVPASVATPTGDDHAAVLVLAPAGTYLVGEPLTTATATVVRCMAPTGCAPQSTVEQPATLLTTSPGPASTLLRWSGGMAVAVDGSTAYTRVPLPARALNLAAATLGEDRVWAVVGIPGGAEALLWAPPAGGSWHDITAADPSLQQSAWLLALPGGRLLDLLLGGGLRCSADAGISWSPRCP